MQQIQLINYERPTRGTGYIRDRFYYVHANRELVQFKSKKKLLKFLADLNAHLNLQAHTLNRLTADTYTEYRYYFFHFNQTDRDRLETEFSGLNRLFGLLITRSQTANGNSFTYDRLHKICQTLTRIANRLLDHPMNRTATVQRYRLKGIMELISTVENQLKILPHEKENLEV